MERIIHRSLDDIEAPGLQGYSADRIIFDEYPHIDFYDQIGIDMARAGSDRSVWTMHVVPVKPLRGKKNRADRRRLKRLAKLWDDGRFVEGQRWMRQFMEMGK